MHCTKTRAWQVRPERTLKARASNTRHITLLPQMFWDNLKYCSKTFRTILKFCFSYAVSDILHLSGKIWGKRRKGKPNGLVVPSLFPRRKSSSLDPTRVVPSSIHLVSQRPYLGKTTLLHSPTFSSSQLFSRLLTSTSSHLFFYPNQTSLASLLNERTMSSMQSYNAQPEWLLWLPGLPLPPYHPPQQ